MDQTGGDLFLHRRAFDDVAERVAASGRNFERAIVSGCPNPLQGRLRALAEETVFADSIAGIEPATFDLAITLGELEALPDPGLHLFVLAHALRPGGMLAGAIVGGASLPALRSALLYGSSAARRAVLRVHPMIDGPALSVLLSSAGIADAVIDVDRVDVAYRSLGRLVADLRAMGCTSVLAERQPLTRAEWQAARNCFLDGAARRVERFEILHFTGWVRAAWQAPN